MVENKVYKLKPKKIRTKKIFAIIPRKFGDKIFWLKYIYILDIVLQMFLDEVIEFPLRYEFSDKASLEKKLEEYDLTNYERSDKI